MIALGGPKLKRCLRAAGRENYCVSMIALGGPKLKLGKACAFGVLAPGFNDSTGWA